jgi:hypothetical protein
MMPRITYYVAMPFIHDSEGALAAGEAAECPNAKSAVARASSLAGSTAGAVAFSRTGDPELGELEPAVVLATFGEVPHDLSEL